MAIFVRYAGLTAALCLAASMAQAQPLAVHVDAAEAQAALMILDKENRGETVGQEDWSRLFATTGYRRLKTREAAIGRPFTDESFQAFLEAPETRAAAADLRRTLQDWTARPATASAKRALAYLPPGTDLKATVFPMVKPKHNSFVFDLKTDPAIFLYLDPKVPPAKFENTVAHELHHIGLGGACSTTPRPGASPGATKLAEWTGGFGEGLAMLAAAGGPDIHPHAVSEPKERAEWDANAARFETQFQEQNTFFLAVLEGTAGPPADIDAKMMSYFGVQGPWYTVGWRMAVEIERALGRPRLVQAFCGGSVLSAYNDAATLANARGGQLPLWNERLVKALTPAG